MQGMSARPRNYAVYDCFTRKRFGGNPGGIVFDAGALDAETMQAVAREIAAPVTGFVTGTEEDGHTISLRFFMPSAEIGMCGHVTIGLVTHLYRSNPGISRYRVRARAGDVEVSVTPTGDGPPLVMMALDPPKPLDRAVPRADLARALGLAEDDLPDRPHPAAWDGGLRHLFVPMSDPMDVADLIPDFAALKALSLMHDLHTVAPFAMEPDGSDGPSLVIRDFCPALGVDETPASGTTNAALAGYLLGSGLIDVRTTEVVAYQGAEIGRPSEIITELSTAAFGISELKVGGHAVVSLSGTLEAL